jgi:acyl-coenzyme A synthetase/AMP-(fatty) acid ligase
LHSCFVIPFVIRHSCFVIRLSSIVVSELPKTATGKVQKYVLRGKQPGISKQ